jgi:hypothetical protein
MLFFDESGAEPQGCLSGKSLLVLANLFPLASLKDPLAVPPPLDRRLYRIGIAWDFIAVQRKFSSSEMLPRRKSVGTLLAYC